MYNLPFFDETTGDVVTRIVYDGAPEAGKTTNLHRIAEQIGERRAGPLLSPHTVSRQTRYFDWLEFNGGFIDGRRVKCQLLSVPGQRDRVRYRRRLLSSADVIVFVTDSDAASIPRSIRVLEETKRIRDRVEQAIGFVFQANKQDGPGALAPQAVAEACGLGSDVPIMGAIAETGVGVMNTFVLAARLAIDQARVLIGSGRLEALPSDMRDAERMLEALLAQDSSPNTDGGRASDSNQPNDVPPRDDCGTQKDWLDSGEEENVAEVAESFRTLLPPLPDAARVGAGHVWPPATGRGYVNAAMSVGGRVHSVCVGDTEVLTITSSNGWVAQTFPQDVFRLESEAQAALIRSAHMCIKNANWYDTECSLAVYPDGEGWRLWCFGRARPTLSDRILQARDEVALARALVDAETAERQLQSHPPTDGLEHAICLDTIVCDGGRAYVQGLRHVVKTSEDGQVVKSAKELAARVAHELTLRGRVNTPETNR